MAQICCDSQCLFPAFPGQGTIRVARILPNDLGVSKTRVPSGPRRSWRVRAQSDRRSATMLRNSSSLTCGEGGRSQTHGAFHQSWMVYYGLTMDNPVKMMIWGYLHFWKPPYVEELLSRCKVQCLHSIEELRRES